ncbi:MAG TPA: hypothetical protein VNM22_20590 [Candidatus Limnocylindrales bacterium]|nr:hypothetical protein [Candidatus Limnocylindrales bacterium]
MAYAPAGSDLDRDDRLQLGVTRERTGRGNLIGREALARSDPDNGNNAHRYPREARQQSGGLDGAD